jgi:hypothetical protein
MGKGNVFPIIAKETLDLKGFKKGILRRLG